MKILLTIKAVLNYLYNNLIDLVWVKKIKFEDDTEINTKPLNLFDIKIMSEAIANKNWCCISDAQPKRLNKASVPTAYNFLKNKLYDINTSITNWQKHTTNFIYNIDFYYDGYWYYHVNNDTNVYRTQYLDFTNVETVKQNAFADSVDVEQSLLKKGMLNNQLVFVCVSKDYNLGTNVNVKIYDENWDLIKDLTLQNHIDIAYIYDFCFVSDKNKIFFLPAIVNSTNTYPYEIIVYDYNNDTISYPTINLGTWEDYGTKYLHGWNIVYYKGYVYTATSVKYVKINVDNYSYEVKNISENGDEQQDTSENYIVVTPSTLIVNENLDELYCIACGRYGSVDSTYGRIEKAWKINKDGTWKSLYFNNSSDNLTELKTITLHKNTFYFNIVNGADYILKSTKDFSNFTTIYTQTDESVLSKIIFNDNEEICLFCFNDGNDFYNLSTSITPIVYTDTINGTDIKYYKCDDWKICTPDIAIGNDTNLQSVFEFLGYLNYWWIDITNEQIALQRNSNIWTMMYVGDDYKDSSLPSGNYRKNKIVNELIEDDSASITVNIKGNQFYKFTNNAITDITIDSCDDSIEETTIKFTTGNSAPTLTDNASLVWYDGIPTLLANTSYTIVIVDKTAYYQEN